jgi:hypothetical protein
VEAGLIPVPPTEFGLINNGPTSFTCLWWYSGPVNEITSAFIDVSVSPDFSTFITENTSFTFGNGFAQTGLTDSTTYYCRVRVGNQYGVSASSQTSTVLTEP